MPVKSFERKTTVQSGPLASHSRLLHFDHRRYFCSEFLITTVSDFSRSSYLHNLSVHSSVWRFSKQIKAKAAVGLYSHSISGRFCLQYSHTLSSFALRKGDIKDASNWFVWIMPRLQSCWCSVFKLAAAQCSTIPSFLPGSNAAHCCSPLFTVLTHI